MATLHPIAIWLTLMFVLDRQRSVIEFLTAEGEMPIRIHERLKNVYGDTTVDVSTVRRWVRRCKEAEGQTR